MVLHLASTPRSVAPAGSPRCRRQRMCRNACFASADRRPASLATDTTEATTDMPTSRRGLLALGVCVSIASAGEAQALGFKKELKRKKIPIEEYSTTEDGILYYDLAEGKGEAVKAGSVVTVHFDCKYKGIDAVSTRAARTLGGNRTVAEPYQFLAGEEVSNKARKIIDSAGGLFSGSGGPKPPPALSTAVIGMKAGGKRTVIVPPELGFGDRGEQEIPPGATFDLLIEVLKVGA